MRSTPEYTEHTERDNHHQGSAREMTAASDRPELPHSPPPLPCIRCIPWFISFKAVLLCMLWAVVPIDATAAESISVLLQKGIYAEETEGNLDAAIKIYEGIVAESEANRALVAQAQYRLGICQLKKGKKNEAEVAFRKIIEQFSDQAEPSAIAREKLNELGKAANSIVVRKLTAPESEPGHCVSLDGRLLSFTDWETGDLAVRELSTGQDRRLTNKGSWKESSEFAETSVFSPDGKQLAYGWYPKDGKIEVRLISLDDPNPRVMMTNEWVRPEAWSPDGTSIAVATDILKEASSIRLISPSDGSVKTVKSLPFRQIDRISFSWDSRYLAYSYANEENPESDVYVVDLSTGTEHSVVEHPADDKLIGWTPGASSLLFRSDRNGSMDIWEVDVRDGKSNGEPVLLKSSIGEVSALGISQTGAFYYGISSGGLDLFRAQLDLDSGKLLGKTRSVSHPPSAVGVMRASLSPSGRYCAYLISRRGDIQWPELYVLDVTTHLHRRLYAAESPQLAEAPIWFGDETALIHIAKHSDGKRELMLVDAKTGAASLLPGAGIEANQIVAVAGDSEQLAFVFRDIKEKRFLLMHQDRRTKQETTTALFNEHEGNAQYYFKLSADLKVVFYTIVPGDVSEEKPAVATRLDLESGQALELMRWPSLLLPFPSPDPTLVAVAGRIDGDGSLVHILRIEENQVRKVATAKAPGQIYYPTLFGFQWSADSHHLIFHRNTKKPTGARDMQAWIITAQTGNVRQIDPAIEKLNRIVGLDSSKGEIFLLNWNMGVNELWVMENFLPTVTTMEKQ
ncbi:MAG: tetratricopeptide repeat protein [Verrucomicrobia bacterium]|nr:tetratricopeptide repeat protein [Verrucomicrobiota bacterium]